MHCFPYCKKKKEEKKKLMEEKGVSGWSDCHGRKMKSETVEVAGILCLCVKGQSV